MSVPSNKTVILTGASRGIGRAVAHALSQRGVRLVLNARGEDRLRETAEGCTGADARIVAGNAASASIAQKLVDEARDMGSFAGFIHAAGVLHPGPLLNEIEEHAFREVLDASLTAAYQLVRFAVPVLEGTAHYGAERGIAVFFGSGAAEIAQPGIAAYCIAKAAEEHLMRQLAAESDGVYTFAYRPGVVETRMQQQARSAEGGAADTLRKTFQSWKDEGRLIEPEESAQGLLKFIEQADRLHGRSIRIGEAV
ncbi:SDR family NAD(P)-dependent oxidoreductase [Oceanidesulfovibrio marinus]|uniref:SDR family NAD(P)-dependent oxidoreductase n=1 Tax=Oceanidesulfovibrio marinus TaxID=370038 RepID=A0ABX6NEX9_9BACT|nr:SDR family NAD(P)-dependent oxidoreductase [Oceanidesulfovibrio marinus]QJT09154.1 SDR family NAD(P)-dependent oxidoreductase [Oceanidesulfovibrio marinus]